MLYLSPQESLTLTELAAMLRSPAPVRLAPTAEVPLGAHPAPEAAPTQATLTAATVADNSPFEPVRLLTALAVGTGPELPAALVRRLLLLAAYRLGRTGAAAGPVVRRLLDFYNREVWPVVYEQGSLGAGHDQVPLAHLALPLVGLGEVNYQGYRLAAADVLGLFGWEPPQLPPALALGLLGGSDFTLAYATEALERAEHLRHAAETIGSVASPATNLATDPDLFTDAQQAIEAACHTDEPAPTSFAELLLPTNDRAPALDRALAHLTRVVAQVGAQSAQRTAALVAQSEHLAAPGPQFGLLALPRAAASLVQRCGNWVGALATANPFLRGAAAAQEARRVVELAEQLVGLELLATAQALDERGRAGGDPGRLLSPDLARAVAAFREHVTFAAHDRVLAPDLHRAARFVRDYAWV